jgi:hypothetical protein
MEIDNLEKKLHEQQEAWVRLARESQTTNPRVPPPLVYDPPPSDKPIHETH